MFGNPYTAIYGYTAPLGAYQVMYGAHKRRKKKGKDLGKKGYTNAGRLRAHILNLMALRVRMKKRLAHAKAHGKGPEAEGLKLAVHKLNKKIDTLRAKLHAMRQPAPSESEAAEVEASTPETISSRTMHPADEADQAIRKMGDEATGSTTMHAKRHHYRKHKMPHRHKKVKGRMGIRTSAVRHHKYALHKKHAARLHQLNPRKHRARLPGQRAFDGRRRQGPISAQEVAQQDISPDSDMDMDMMPMPTDLTSTDIPDIDFDMAPSPDGMIDSASMAAEAALSGVMDFAGDLWSNKFFKYGAIGLGLWFVFGKKHR